MRTARRTALLLVACLLGQPPAWAADRPAKPVSQAAALKIQGDRAMDALRYDDALAAYRQAYDTSHDPALLYNQARAYEALGDYPAALDYLDRFDSEAPPALKARVPDLAGLTYEVRGKVATITVKCNVDGAEVFVRDKRVGVTPLAPLRTTAGHAALRVRADGYKVFERTLDLAGGASTETTVDLALIDTSGVLIVRSSIAGVHVTLDGKLRGDVPLELSLPAGVHDVKLDRSGYEPTATSVVLNPGKREAVDIPLVRSPLIVERWWFWTLLGAAAAGGVATYFVVTTERSPDKGSINPGVISAPTGAASLHF